MILKCNQPFALNLGEDLEFISVFAKGKKKQSVSDYRVRLRGVNSNKEFLFGLEKPDPHRDSFLGQRILLLDQTDWTVVTPTHFKNRNWNYYYLNSDSSVLNSILQEWKNSSPMIHIGNFIHQRMNLHSAYTWAYEFNNIKY